LKHFGLLQRRMLVTEVSLNFML